MEKYILTGGPGTGKTAVLKGLSKQGFATVPEAARQIILEEQQKERINSGYQGILPQNNLSLFQNLVIGRQLEQEMKIPFSSGNVFLDRSLVDPIAYAEVGNITPSSDLYQLIEEAEYKRMFFLERLPFYEQDEERKEDSGLAQRIHEKLYQVYDRLGFDIVTVPVGKSSEKELNIEERVKFILSETNSEKNREIEKKYRVEHNRVREMLERYSVKYDGTDHEENTLYDFRGILKKAGCVFRIRENNDKHILTLKGPNKSREMTNKTEYNLPIPKNVSKTLQMILPESVSYSKRRENYHPLGDTRCTISLDYLPGLGEYVEIEAGTENQVLLWERRLGLAEYAIKESYPQLVGNDNNPNSR